MRLIYQLLFALVLFSNALPLAAQFVGVNEQNPTHSLHVKPLNPMDEPLRVEGVRAQVLGDTTLLILNPASGVVRYISLTNLTDTLISNFTNNDAFLDSLVSIIYNYGDTLLYNSTFINSLQDSIDTHLDSLTLDNNVLTGWVAGNSYDVDLSSLESLPLDSIINIFYDYADTLLYNSTFINNLQDSIDTHLDSLTLDNNVLTGWVDGTPYSVDLSTLESVSQDSIIDIIYNFGDTLLYNTTFINSLQDSIDTHLDSLTLNNNVLTGWVDGTPYNVDLSSLETISQDSIIDIIYNFGDTLLYNTTFINSLQDSIDTHLDSLTLNNNVLTGWVDGTPYSVDLSTLESVSQDSIIDIIYNFGDTLLYNTTFINSLQDSIDTHLDSLTYNSGTNTLTGWVNGTGYSVVITGIAGAPGADGADGLSAYEIWLDEGNVGTEADFIASLTGPAGAAGAAGPPGPAPTTPTEATTANVWSTIGNSGISAATNFLGTTDAQPLVVRTDNTERMRVLATGNVGIGANNPSERLDVNGNARIRGLTTAGIVKNNATGVLSTGQVNLASTTEVTGTLPVGNGGTGLTAPGAAGNVLVSNGTTWTSGNAAGQFIQNQSAAVQTGTFWINGVGRVGDGTAAAPSLSFNSNAATGLFRVGANIIGFSTNGTERWSIDAAGILQSNGAQTIRTSTGNLTLAAVAGNGNVNLIPHDAGGSGRVLVNLATPSTAFDADGNNTILQVHGNIGLTRGSIHSIYANGDLRLSAKDNGAGTNRIVFMTNANDNKMVIHGNGRIMIGDDFNSAAPGNFRLQIQDVATNGDGRGRANDWTTYSDSRVKDNQQLLKYGLKEVMQINPKSYIHKSSSFKDGVLTFAGPIEHTIGFIAQELYEIIPEVVYKPENEQEDLWSVSYSKITPVLVKAIQEQQAIIESQQQQLIQFQSLLETQGKLIEQQSARLKLLEDKSQESKVETEHKD
jgi:hypothetical protein